MYHKEGYKMRKVAVALAALVLLSMVGFVSAAITIDGDYTDWTSYQQYTNLNPSGYAGANITKLWVSWNDTYLFLFLFTNNTASWNVAYGFAFDVNVSYENSTGVGWGYENLSTGDAWGRHIAFNASYPFLPDYELYFWWNGTTISSENLAKWSGTAWTGWTDLKTLGGDYAYTGNSTDGLQTLEIAIPWSALGGKPSDNEIAVAAWVAGGDGSSAVKTIGPDPSVPEGDSWTDWDNLGLLKSQVVPLDSTTEVPFFSSLAVALAVVLGAVLVFRRR